jgi:hypothetical protein
LDWGKEYEYVHRPELRDAIWKKENEMKLEKVTCFKTSDGEFFEEEWAAHNHEKWLGFKEWFEKENPDLNLDPAELFGFLELYNEYLRELLSSLKTIPEDEVSISDRLLSIEHAREAGKQPYD